MMRSLYSVHNLNRIDFFHSVDHIKEENKTLKSFISSKYKFVGFGVNPYVCVANPDTNVTVRIYDDPYEDGSEDIIFQYSITGTTDAIAGSTNQTCTVTINDDDAAPSAEETVYLFQEDFESGITGWSLIAFGGHDGTTANWWNTGTAISINGNSAYLSEGSGVSSYQKTKANQLGLRTSVIDATGYSDLELAFDFIFVRCQNVIFRFTLGPWFR